MAKYAFLSASSAHRWLECPPSAKACEDVDERASPYAQQGTDCHELCAYLVEKALGMDANNPTETLDYYDQGGSGIGLKRIHIMISGIIKKKKMKGLTCNSETCIIK